MNLEQPAVEPKTTTRKKAAARGKKNAEIVEAGEDDDMALDKDPDEKEIAQPAKKQKKTATAKTPDAKAPRPVAAKRDGGREPKVVEAAPEEIDHHADVMDVDEDQPMADATAIPPWLAGLTASLNGKLDGIGGKFDEQTTAINSNFEEQATQFNTKFNEQSSSFDTKLATVTAKLGTLSTTLGTLSTEVQTVDGSVRNVQEALSKEVQTIAEELKNIQDAIQQHSQDIAKNEQAIKCTNKRVDGIAKEVEELGAKFKEFLEQSYLRRQANKHFEETKDIMGDLADVCVDHDDRSKNELKAVLRKVDELKSM